MIEMVKFRETVLDFFDDWCARPYRETRYWLRSRFVPSHRYHVVRTGLRPGYYDEDILILHACMSLLERFIAWHGGEEKLAEFTKELVEKADEWGGVESTALQAKNQTEALAIYIWWKYERPPDEHRVEQLYELPKKGETYREKYGVIDDLEKKMHDDEQKMLHRLIDIRQSLWE